MNGVHVAAFTRDGPDYFVDMLRKVCSREIDLKTELSESVHALEGLNTETHLIANGQVAFI